MSDIGHLSLYSKATIGTLPQAVIWSFCAFATFHSLWSHFYLQSEVVPLQIQENKYVPM